MKVQSVILQEKESVEYGYDKGNLKDIAPDFEGNHVSLDAHDETLDKVIGVIDESWYEDGTGVVVEASIYREEPAQALVDWDVFLAPKFIIGAGDGKIFEVDSVFLTRNPDSVVGGVEEYEA